MLKRYLPFILLVTIIVACSKNKLETKPSIEVKSYNTKEVFPGQDLIINLEFGDKEEILEAEPSHTSATA